MLALDAGNSFPTTIRMNVRLQHAIVFEHEVIPVQAKSFSFFYVLQGNYNAGLFTNNMNE
jgi:hypothetical protein